ncbi:MAG TPA: thiamine pyrophosphate-dependent enzyme [Verrucomicrobiae bacterium]|nr:thiamine pyrophosphate-dependent enzyme [Verrucomicrobiae bacterium]
MDTALYKRAAGIRQFEELLLQMFSEGKLSGTVHTCIGQELCALAVIDALEKNDWIFSNHRCHGHYLARFGEVEGLLAEIMGLPQGICAGRGGSQHVFRERFLSNGVQGGGVPIAAGCAMALKQFVDEKAVVVAFIGDGTLGQGVIYETLNLASKWKVPLVVVLEKNGYAQSTDTSTTIAGEIRGRFEAFGWKYCETSIWDEIGLFSTAKQAVQFAREHGVPVALCIDCYRLKAHSKGDDNRTSEEINKFLERDPMRIFEKANPEAAQQVRQNCAQELNKALKSLENAPVKAFTEMVSPTQKISSQWWEVPAISISNRVVERIRSGLQKLLTRDDRVILLGEDIEDPYGGAFKATKGLSTEFPGRVRNTPISEAAITGFGNGLALAGLRPVVEIMFGDFVMLAADQLVNQSSKFSYMYNGQVEVPVILRAAMGGKRGYGATHSQSLEKHFFGTPGLSIAALNSVFDPELLLERIHAKINHPCLLIENKLLYSLHMHQQALDGRRWLESGADFPMLKLPATGTADLTVVTYGGMVEDVEAAVRDAFIEDEIQVEVLVPTMIYPLDVQSIVESVAKTGRLLVVEEGQGFSGFGAEVIAACCEQLKGRAIVTGRVHAESHPIPCSRELEKIALPSAAKIRERIVSLTRT